jgi:hypothetical protein
VEEEETGEPGSARTGRGSLFRWGQRGDKTTELIWLTVPEVRRLLLALAESPETFEFHIAWSCWRRHHQAVARRCHAARRSRRQPVPLKAKSILVEKRAEPDLGLAEGMWRRVAPLLPPQKPPTGRPATDHRKVLGGILWVQRNGGAWRLLPAQFGPWSTVYGRYREWRRSGLWQHVAEEMQKMDTDVLETAA